MRELYDISITTRIDRRCMQRDRMKRHKRIIPKDEHANRLEDLKSAAMGGS